MPENKKYQKQKALITLLLSQVRAMSQYCRRTWQKVTAANKDCCEQHKVNKMMTTEKFQNPETFITLLLSQVRADIQYCQRAWQKITAANRRCEQYKTSLNLNTLILTAHNGALTLCGD
jgi:NADH:ubiquinone oxidoreductase subunit